MLLRVAKIALGIGWLTGAAASSAFGQSPSASAALEKLKEKPAVYLVQPGETLWRIAHQHGLSVAQLAQLNGLVRPQDLRVGMQLRLPRGDGTTAQVDKKNLVQVQAEHDAPQQATVAGAAARPVEGVGPLAGVNAPSEPVVETKAPPAGQSQVVAALKERESVSEPANSAAVGKARSKSAKYPLSWPVEGAIIQRFGGRQMSPHDGIDIAAERGTPIRAAADGQVLFAAAHVGYGNLVLLRHSHGLITVYAHQDSNLVRKGQWVRRGAVLARVGTSGRAVKPHVHFEVRRGVQPENPLFFLPP